MLSDIPYIETYRGFASEHRLIYICRLLEDQNYISKPDDRWWRNLKNTLRKAASREIPHGKVQITLEDKTLVITSDHEGYIYLDLEISSTRDDQEIWKPISISGINSSFAGEVLLPSCNANFGVISDIDDTVLVTDVRSPMRMAINTLFKNPYQRKSFEGMDDFFNKLHKAVNPVFYLSNSPWNLYQNIQQFLSLHQMPKGPILLRDFGMHFPEKPRSYSHHKEISIELLLEMYPDLPFILIGDATQEDAIIYSHIKQKYPERVKKIYIREIGNKARMKSIMSELNVLNQEIIFFTDYVTLS